MSKLVAFAAIQGGYNIVSEVEGDLRNALAAYNADTKVEFPNTGYYLPVIYSLTGMKVETLEDLKKPLEFARGLLPPHVRTLMLSAGSQGPRAATAFEGKTVEVALPLETLGLAAARRVEAVFEGM